MIKNFTPSTFINYLLAALTICGILHTQQISAQCCSNGVNLLSSYNPDFSAPIGNVPRGFTNDNTYSSTPGAGTYVIITSRNYGACSATPEFDHTTGNNTGKYLWFDTPGAATVANPVVAWMPYDSLQPPGSESLLTVTPNTNYVFSVWIRDLARMNDCVSGGAPLMGLRINGTDVAQIDLGLTTSPCCPQWTYMCAQWNSGAATTVLIQIESRRGAGFTDLGIDDVYFGSTSTVNFSLGNDTALCTGQSLLLHDSLPAATYLWNDNSTGTSLNVNSPGLYWLQITQNNCSGRDSISVSQLQLPQVVLGNDTLICNQPSYLIQPVITGGTASSYLWQDNSTAATYNANATGIYWLQASNQCGNDRDSVSLALLSSPSNFTLGNDTTICSGTTLTLSPTPASAGNYIWQDNSTGATYTATGAGLYSLSVTNLCGSQGDAITISQLSPPTAFSLGNDTTLCNGTTLTLSPAPIPLGSFVWQDNSTNSSFNASNAGNYFLTVLNNCGSVSDSVNVSTNTAPVVSLANDTTLCNTDSLLLTAQTIGLGNLLWSNGSTNSSIYATGSGNYEVTLGNNCGTSQDDIQVTLLALPERPFNNAIIDSCEGLVILLDAKNAGMSYQWSTTQTQQTITTPTPGLYIVTITNMTICVITDSVTIRNRTCDVCRAAIPTAFSPNGDGVNDIFKPIFNCALQSFAFHIYNRWGEMVFESDFALDGWDGTFKNIQQPLGTYVYYADYRYQGASKPEKSVGNVTIVR